APPRRRSRRRRHCRPRAASRSRPRWPAHAPRRWRRRAAAPEACATPAPTEAPPPAGRRTGRRRTCGSCGLLLQAAQLGEQLGLGFGMLRIRIDALDRAHDHALRFVEMAYALGAQRRIDDVDRFPLRDRLVRADRLADVAIDAELVDLQ